MNLFADTISPPAPWLPTARRLALPGLRSSQPWSGSSEHAAKYWSTRTDVAAATVIRDAIMRAGQDPARLTVDDLSFLSPLDEFHCLGPQATVELGRLADLAPGARVLDLGSGIGGPSRRLVVEFGCDVIGLDITREFVNAGRQLVERLGLSSRISYHWGDAINLPFPRGSFDFVWMQVASANIFDRPRLYKEIRRVLRSDGRVAFFEMLAGPAGRLYFPVPWALDESTSALLTPSAKRTALTAAGLRITVMQDMSEQAAAWFHDEARLRRGGVAPRLGFEVLLPNWGCMAFNQWRNIVERRLFFTYIIAEPA